MARLCGADVVVQLLREQGVTEVLGIPGATEVHFMEALERAPDIRYILGLQENVCVSMAEGYARASGRPAFLNLHTVSGLAAAMAALSNAKLGRVPMVIMVGLNDSRHLLKEPQLSGDVVGLAKSQCKWAAELHHGEELPIALRRAFKLAAQAPCGPVVLSVPSNLLTEELEYEPAAPSACARYLPEPRALDRAAELLRAAQNPAIITQEGVAQSPGGVERLTELAEMLGARVYQAWTGDVCIPFRHPLNGGDIDTSGPAMVQLLEKSDLVLAVGCPVFNDAGYSGLRLPLDGVTLVQIHDDPWEIAKNLPADCALQGDPAATMEALLGRLRDDERLAEAARMRRAAAEVQARAAHEAADLRAAADWETGPVPVPAMAGAIELALPEHAVVVDDSWSSSATLRATLDMREPGSYLRPRSGGSIGTGFGVGLGAQLAHGDKPVLVVSGDGSAIWGIQALWTAAHERLPVVFLVVNNAVYRQVKLVRRGILGDYPLTERHLGMELDDPVIRFADLAESMGVTARRVETACALEAALRDAFAAGCPCLIEVMAENSPT